MITSKQISENCWIITDIDNQYKLRIENRYFVVHFGSLSKDKIRSTFNFSIKPFIEENKLFYYYFTCNPSNEIKNPFNQEISDIFRKILKLSNSVFG